MSFFWFLFTTKKPLGSLGTGDVRSLFQGQSVERDSSRPYILGDDSARINWKTTAKYNDTFVDVLSGEQSLRFLLCVDLTKNVFLQKQKVSSSLSVLFNELQSGHHSLAWSLANKWAIKTIASMRRPHHWYTTLASLFSHTHGFDYTSGLYGQLLACTKLSSRSFIVLVGDFLDWDDRCLSLYSYLAERHAIVWLVVPVPQYSFLGLPFVLRTQKISLPFKYIVL